MPKLKSYQCFFGIHENQKYTIEATGFKELRRKISTIIGCGTNGRWYRVKIKHPKRLPPGAMRFLIKDSKTYSCLGLCRDTVLIIPE